MDNESWDYFLSNIIQNNEIDNIEKQELLRNWGYLREVLHDDWFKKEENKHHHLRYYFSDDAPWCLRWIGELGLGIKFLKKKDNFDDIFRRLLSNSEFEGAYSEFRVGYSLFKLGVLFEFLKRRKKPPKMPDIAMNISDRKICLEITTKNTPDPFFITSKTFHEINKFFTIKVREAPNNIVYFFDILTPLYPATAELIPELCKDLFENVKKSGFEEFHVPDVIDIYILNKENIYKVPQEKRVKRSISNEPDELCRIKDTITDKDKQRKSENPNILLIFDMLLPHENKRFFDSKNVSTIEKHINRFSNLSAVMIYVESYYRPDSESFIKREGNYIIIQEYDGKLLMLKKKIIILNELAQHPLLPHEIEILKNI